MVKSLVKPAGNELRVLSHKNVRDVVVNGRAPLLDRNHIDQIGYQLELKCRGVEF